MTEMQFPYNLPIWRDSFRLKSPDGKLIAEISSAAEVSMGNPTIGTLQLSNGFVLDRCNPSFIWSDDSRYLVVPHYFSRFGFFRRQRLVLIDTAECSVFESKKVACYFQPKSFSSGKLIVTVEPHSDATEFKWSLPEDLNQFDSLK